MTSVFKKDPGRSSIPVNKELNNGKIIYIYIYIYKKRKQSKLHKIIPKGSKKMKKKLFQMAHLSDNCKLKNCSENPHTQISHNKATSKLTQ